MSRAYTSKIFEQNQIFYLKEILNTFLKNISGFKIIKECTRINLQDKNFVFWRCKGETSYAFYFSYGIDQSENKAREKAILECIERYFISFNKTERKRMILKSYAEIKNNAINSSFLFSFLNDQYLQKKFKYVKLKDDDKIYWAKGRSLFLKKAVFIPAFAVYCGYQKTRFEPLIGRATSNGCAVGQTLRAAIINASLELIERDAVLIRWFNKLPSPKIKPDYLSDDLKNIIKTTEKNYQANILINDLTTDFKIPIVSVLLRSNTPPYFTFGSAANFSIREAIIKALQESILKRAELKNFKKYNLSYKNFDHIKNLYQHAEFYARNNEYKPFRFLYESPYLSKSRLKRHETISLKVKTTKKKIEYLKHCCKRLKKDIIFINLTPKLFKCRNLYISRVIIPGLQSLNSEYKCRYLGNARLYALPLKLGAKNHIQKKSRLNVYPHPIG